MKVTNNFLKLDLRPIREVEPISNTANVAKYLRLDKSWAQGKSYYYYSDKGTEYKYLQLTYWYTHRSFFLQ